MKKNIKFSNFDVFAITKELGTTLPHGKIDNVYEIDGELLILKIKTRLNEKKILIVKNDSRLNFTNFSYPIPKYPSQYIISLRKYLKNRVILSVNQHNFDRIIIFEISNNEGNSWKFIVELFNKGDEVIFSEVSPRPHDTGMVTMISQDLSQFALHARAVLGLPIPEIHFHGPSASSVILVSGESDHVTFNNINAALHLPDTQLRLFGKPEVKGQRRMGVVLARDNSVEQAKQKAIAASSEITTNL